MIRLTSVDFPTLGSNNGHDGGTKSVVQSLLLLQNLPGSVGRRLQVRIVVPANKPEAGVMFFISHLREVFSTVSAPDGMYSSSVITL